jgi:hypothetical protein
MAVSVTGLAFLEAVISEKFILTSPKANTLPGLGFPSCATALSSSPKLSLAAALAVDFAAAIEFAVWSLTALFGTKTITGKNCDNCRISFKFAMDEKSREGTGTETASLEDLMYGEIRLFRLAPIAYSPFLR